ncbi:MAG TPA: hypothetical protein VFM05_04835 [Candidatus Saccharimonadales bacterium]|nr:hypothetical protein [Candidatus Saccharimonadales bacterium]
MSIKPILKEQFYHDGRGPELQRVYYRGRGQIIEAVDYFNHDVIYSPENLRHLFFTWPQVFMFTPEEVYNYMAKSLEWSKYKGAAIVDLGRSAWLESFNPDHLSQCSHYQIMFYDEYLDIICEGIDARIGSYGDGRA